MAWINNEWLAREERQVHIDSTKELVDLMLKQDNLTRDELTELDGYIQLLEKLERIHRSEVDLLYFAIEYFSERYNPGNEGNWEDFDLESVDDAPDFHKEICGRMDEISQHEKNAKDATAASRGHAKSSYLSRAKPLREIVFRLRRYIIAISETPNVAEGNLDWISVQLKMNKKLREDFGPLLHPKQQLNARDNNNEFVAAERDVEDNITKQIALMQAASTGQALRGRNWNGVRPDMIIADDLEDARSGGNAATPEQREKMRDWFTQVVMALGGPTGKRTAYIYMGTIVHAESLLNHVIEERVDFKSRKYQALIEEPERMDLWEKCETIYQDNRMTKEERLESAQSFYHEHKKEMLKGSNVLWPQVMDLWRLMLWKWDNGSKAFNTEMQNNPRDEESMVFNPDLFNYYTDADMIDQYGRQLPLVRYGFWDIASDSKRADYNAIVIVARNTVTGALYVENAWAQKCAKHVALKKAVEIIDEYAPRMFAVETIGIGHGMDQQLVEELAQKNIYGTRIRGVSSHSEKNKNARIASLEPLVESGFLRFKKNQRLLLEQLEDFPTASHDDLPDALAGAVNLSGGVRRRIKTYRKKPAGV